MAAVDALYCCEKSIAEPFVTRVTRVEGAGDEGHSSGEE
eukprot:CAMPEP_0118923610 /NCGR_PEP_ID=MMETSP1169-20130426/2069_1 /TAXON_ID=36882 /ORGANISM="Pyramimonas obovata, Strain CCMP722" /LENGTH=38 /DNA_ID= /DNA_START= /DNA_END= /DNA_ORIENTATION=